MIATTLCFFLTNFTPLTTDPRLIICYGCPSPLDDDYGRHLSLLQSSDAFIDNTIVTLLFIDGCTAFSANAIVANLLLHHYLLFLILKYYPRKRKWLFRHLKLPFKPFKMCFKNRIKPNEMHTFGENYF